VDSNSLTSSRTVLYFSVGSTLFHRERE